MCALSGAEEGNRMLKTNINPSGLVCIFECVSSHLIHCIQMIWCPLFLLAFYLQDIPAEHPDHLSIMSPGYG